MGQPTLERNPNAKPDFIEKAVRISRYVTFDEDNHFQTGKTNESLTEATPQEHGVSDDILNTTITNPDTGKKIKVKSALQYDKKTKVYKAALGLIKKKHSPDVAKKVEKDSGDIDKEKYKKYVDKATKTLDVQFTLKDENGKKVKVSDALKMDKDSEMYQTAFNALKDKMHAYKTFSSFSKKKKTSLLQMAVNQYKMEKEFLGTTTKTTKGSIDTTSPTTQDRPDGKKPEKGDDGDSKRPFVSDEELSRMKVAPLWKIWDALNKCAESQNEG